MIGTLGTFVDQVSTLMAKKNIEQQNIEFKESWRDEHLKAICGFANTKGGQLRIGIDDAGSPKGVKEARKLLEDLPNKIKDMLGVIPSVEIKKVKGKEIVIIEIKPYESPISYGGKIYMRSGSTTQVLNGSELERFLLKKNNRSWESIVDDRVGFDDIDDSALIKSKEKFPLVSAEKSKKQLLSRLHLTDKGKITRASILLFGKDPQQFYPSAYIKVGRFSEDDEPITTDEIRGNLFDQAEKTMEVLKNKYLTSKMNIKGLYRSDDLEYPERALREAIVNAIAHKDYSGTHIHIKVYADKLVFWNPGELHHDLTIELLKEKHPSHPRNRLIAQQFFYCGLIESWGSGTMKMIKECVKVGLPEPMFEELSNGLQVTFPKDTYTQPQLEKMGLSKRHITAILYLKKNGTINNQTYQTLCKTEKRTATRDLSELVKLRILEKSGNTGKGTIYRLTGAKSIQADRIEEVEGDSSGELDLKLKVLDKELEEFDPEEELKLQFNKDLFLVIFDGWFSDLLNEVLQVIQKFNRYFVNPGHYVNLPQPLGGLKFVDDDVREFIVKLREQINRQASQLMNYEATANISTFYGSFRKAGLDTFGCNYAIEMKFSQDWYEVFMDDEVMQRNRKLLYKRQYHKVVTKQEIQFIAKKFGEVIFQHITNSVAKVKEKKKKGSYGTG
jgi:ATP-dependent DNA helicase RecG